MSTPQQVRLCLVELDGVQVTVLDAPGAQVYIGGGNSAPQEHGNQPGGSLHALATSNTAGFLSPSLFNQINAATSQDSIDTLVRRSSSGNFSANIITAALSGNASTATRLRTARNIAGVPFDGSQSISLTAAGVGAEPAGATSNAIAALRNEQHPFVQYELKTNLGTAAYADIGTLADQVAAGNDGRFDSLGVEIAEIRQQITSLTHLKCIYVAKSGSDTEGIGTADSPFLSIKKAADEAQPGDVIFVSPGTYVESELPIRWKRDVTLFGSGLRSTVIQPAVGQEFNDVFKVDSGFWCWGISFAGHQADDTEQSWAISFDELADNRNIGAIGLGAFIFKSPYIQNCTSITAEEDEGTAGSRSVGNTGGGIKVDGDQCAVNSPIRSMVVDSYTQVNLGGPGCLVLNDGYAQLVSFFGTFCTYHVRTETGGQVNLSGGGTSDFGEYGLMADGYSPSPLYTGQSRIAAYGAARIDRAVTIDPATDAFTATGHGLVINDQVKFSASEGQLPAPLEASITYFVVSSGLTANAFKVSATQGGAVINITGTADGVYNFVRQGETEIDVIGFTPNRLGRQITYPSPGSLGSPGNPVTVTSVNGNEFTVVLGTSDIIHSYTGGGTATIEGVEYEITSATYNNITGIAVLTAISYNTELNDLDEEIVIVDDYLPSIGDEVTLEGLSFICNSISRPNAGQLMFPQLVFPRNSSTEAPQAKTFAYTRTGDFTLTYAEAAAADGPEHEYVSGGTAVIGGTDYGVVDAVYDKNNGLVTLTTRIQLPSGNGSVTVEGLIFICPTSAYIVTSSVPINSSGAPVDNDAPERAGYRVFFFSGVNGGLRNGITAGQNLDFRNRSQISAPSHTFEFVGSGTNYDALPWNGGVPNQANAIVETNNGRVYSSNTNEKGDFRVGSQFEVDGTTGSVTINTDQFNLSGLNFIGPFSRNGGISTVGEQLREISNNTSLIASTGAPDGNTVPSQFAVKTYTDNRFLNNVTVTAGIPLTITDTSTQNSAGFWTRIRNLNLSMNQANGLARLDANAKVPASILPSTDSVSEGSTNLYFTQARSRQSISVSGSAGLAYDPATGVLTYTAPTGAGTVTSVGLNLPAGVFTVSGSPVTGSGTLTGALASQSANTVFAGPASGAAATPAFRQLVPADVDLGTTATPQFAGLGLGTAAVGGWQLTMNGAACRARSTVTAASGVYTLNVQAANEFVTAAAINGATTVNLSNLSLIPTGYVWEGIFRFQYTSGTITWFSGNSGYTVKWDANVAILPTANEVETVVIRVVGGTTVIDVVAMVGRTV